jgi:hypothetical protein
MTGTMNAGIAIKPKTMAVARSIADLTAPQPGAKLVERYIFDSLANHLTSPLRHWRRIS